MAAAWSSFPGTADFLSEIILETVHTLNYLDTWRPECGCAFWNLPPLPQKKSRGDHMHQALEHSWASGSQRGQGLVASEADHGVSRAVPVPQPRQGRGRLGMDGRARPKSRLTPGVMTGSHPMGQGWDLDQWDACPGTDITAMQSAMDQRKCSSQEKGWGKWEDLAQSEASSSSSALLSFSTKSEPSLDTCTISTQRQLNS